MPSLERETRSSGSTHLFPSESTHRPRPYRLLEACQGGARQHTPGSAPGPLQLPHQRPLRLAGAPLASPASGAAASAPSGAASPAGRWAAVPRHGQRKKRPGKRSLARRETFEYKREVRQPAPRSAPRGVAGFNCPPGKQREHWECADVSFPLWLSEAGTLLPPSLGAACVAGPRHPRRRGGPCGHFAAPSWAALPPGGSCPSSRAQDTLKRRLLGRCGPAVPPAGRASLRPCSGGGSPGSRRCCRQLDPGTPS